MRVRMIYKFFEEEKEDSYRLGHNYFNDIKEFELDMKIEDVQIMKKASHSQTKDMKHLRVIDKVNGESGGQCILRFLIHCI